MESNQTTYSLSEFSFKVSQALSRDPVLTGAFVVGEISDMMVKGGHCYMTLIEKDPSGTTIARMRATIWANAFQREHKKFTEATGRSLANGMKVRFYGAANYHINYGISFNIGFIDPAYTLGDLERIRREILASLQREGILDANRNLTLLEPPLNIAVISSATAAGYGDFINQLEHNPSGIIFNTLLFPATMQGENTAGSVIRALDLVEQTHNVVHWDCVAIIRGGGATTDMNGFDDLQLARRVATFPIPIVVGIGHERDRCVLDEIACIRCKTPTAVAAWLIDNVMMQWQLSCDLTNRIASYASERLKGEQIRLQSHETMIPALADARLNTARLRLQTIATLIPSAARESTSKSRLYLESLATTLKMASTGRIEREHPLLDQRAFVIKTAVSARLEKEKDSLLNLEKMVEVLDPSSTLKRGYSITRIGGKAIYGSNDVNPGDTIETTTYSGIITSTVIEASHQIKTEKK